MSAGLLLVTGLFLHFSTILLPIRNRDLSLALVTALSLHRAPHLLPFFFGHIHKSFSHLGSHLL